MKFGFMEEVNQLVGPDFQTFAKLLMLTPKFSSNIAAIGWDIYFFGRFTLKYIIERGVVGKH